MNERAGTTGSAGMDEAAGAAGGFAGPAGVWGVNALAAGLAYLLMAVIEPRLRRA
jgi:hypothetical protein